MSTVAVMTGGTSGFGAIAAKQFDRSPDIDPFVGARRPAQHGDSIPLDLRVLDNVRSFATALGERLGHTRIDGLMLNAGIVRADVETRTADGYETTFAVNHLAHYLLLRLVMPRLADGATIVMTTSGTHDPATVQGCCRLATPAPTF